MEDESRDGSHAGCAAGVADARTCSASARARRRSPLDVRRRQNLSEEKGSDPGGNKRAGEGTHQATGVGARQPPSRMNLNYVR